jgi:hypothetical protein
MDVPQSTSKTEGQGMEDMMTGNQAMIARKVLVALRDYLRAEVDALLDTASDLAFDSTFVRAWPLCRSCRPTWRTVLAGNLGSYVNELIARRERTIDRIDQALERLHAGTYGACLQCQLPIPPSCLASLPYADCCIDCEAQRFTDPSAG